jgi:hypothetical protein
MHGGADTMDGPEYADAAQCARRCAGDGSSGRQKIGIERGDDISGAGCSSSSRSCFCSDS